MSIKVMTLVWDYYPEGGSELLLALALADIAQDDGTRIYPGVNFMAAKTRMSRRNVQYLLAKILERGILKVVAQGGITNGVNHTTKYRMDLIALTSADQLDRVQTLHPPEESSEAAKNLSTKPVDNLPTGVQPSVVGGAKQRRKGVQPVAPNTSLFIKIRTPDEQSQGQDQPHELTCAHCNVPITQEKTRLQEGWVCNACYSAYMRGEWSQRHEAQAPQGGTH